jgi:hypothetical protein
MKRMFRCVTAVVTVLIVSGGLQHLRSQEKKITRRELPNSVLSAFQKAYPHARIRGLSREVEKGITYYEIESVDGKTHRDLLYDAGGKISEVEEAIPAKQLPKSVKETLRKEFKKYSIRTAEASTHGQNLTYEVHLTAGKKAYEVTIAPDGKLVSKAEVKMRKGKKTNKEGDEDDD